MLYQTPFGKIFSESPVETSISYSGKTFELPENVYQFFLEQLKKEKIKLLKEEIYISQQAGFTTSNGIKMDSTEDSVTRFNKGLEIAQNNDLTSMDIVDYNNEIHESVSLTDVKKMIKELSNHLNDIYWYKQQKRSEINAATTQQELEQAYPEDDEL